MSVAQKVYTQALLLSGELQPRQETLARLLATAVTQAMVARLRKDVSESDCQDALVAAGSLYTLAALAETDDMVRPESFTAGDLTVHRGDTTAAIRCLRNQAEQILCPYVTDGFMFQGV